MATSASILGIFRDYAMKPDPASSLPPSILLSHSDSSLTIFDAFPKSIFHLLVLPRIKPPLSARHLADLRSLFQCEKRVAKEVLMNLNEEANKVRVMIEEEMMKRYKFKWEIWMGFHPISSMESVLHHRCGSCHSSRDVAFQTPPLARAFCRLVLPEDEAEEAL